MYKLLFIYCFLLFTVLSGKGQVVSIDSLRNSFDQSYGLDVLLINGKKYFPNNNPTTGHPFWRNPDSFTGDISIAGKTFKDQLLKFELNKQEFILLYNNFNGQQGQIILNHASIDSIKTGTFLFIPNKWPDIKQQFVQVIFQGKISCYIGWYKELQFNSTGAHVGYQYFNDDRKFYIIMNGTVFQFHNKSTFLGIFKGKEKDLIRKYLSSNRFRFKKMDQNDLTKLITYCEEILT